MTVNCHLLCPFPQAITQNGGGLGKIAGERCWVELRQILLCRSAPALLHRMRESGLFCHLGLPKNADLTEMGNLWRRGILSRSPNPATCLASILSTLDEVSSCFNILFFLQKDYASA